MTEEAPRPVQYFGFFFSGNLHLSLSLFILLHYALQRLRGLQPA